MPRTVRVGIVGTGLVGSSVAISTLHAGVAQELLLYDTRGDVAEGEAMDLADGAPFYPTATVRMASREEMLDTSVLVIAAGRSGGPTQSRLELLRDNVRLIREIARAITRYAGTVIVVTNPVDVLTFELTRASGLPPARVIGTGTMLDSARLRQSVGQLLSVDPQSVHAQVVGEHGDSEVALWSSAQVAGVPLRRWPDWRPELEARTGDEVRRAAYEIIKRKGATNHAIGLVTASLLRAVLRDERRALTVSRVQEGVLGLRDVALSLPAIVGGAGAVTVVTPGMDDGERGQLEHSVDVLRKAIASLEPDA